MKRENLSPGEESVKLTVSSVTASGYQAGNPPANTLDAELRTMWSADGNGQWITFDLGTAKRIRLVQIATYRGNERKAQLDIQVSSNRTAWATVYSGQSSGTTT